jgi:hypothetical protein
MDFKRYIFKVYVHMCYYSKYSNEILKKMPFIKNPMTYSIGLKVSSPSLSLSATHRIFFSMKC